MLHPHPQSHVALIIRSNWQSTGAFQKAMLFLETGEYWIETHFQFFKLLVLHHVRKIPVILKFFAAPQNKLLRY
jgi:hypothetical protein